MSLALDIIRAAHARGTHHKLALDALDHLSGPDAERWRRLAYRHIAAYLSGAKAPDDEFKDFANHVLHVRAGYWGGAADKVDNWYAHLVKALAGERWSEAAWAAGILSHYYTDPLHPFHTSQSEAENNIHRAVEWSIACAYDELAAQGRREHAQMKPVPGGGPAWLRAFVVEGAEKANEGYEKLIAHYDINRGVVDPPAGLDVVARRMLAELIAYATRSLAAILDRAVAEAGARPPEVALAGDAGKALLRLPRNWLAKRSDFRGERRAVEAMYDELKATGRVEANLPEDERVVREAYAREVEARRLAEREKERSALMAMPSRYARGYGLQRDAAAVPPPAPAAAASAASAAAEAFTPAQPAALPSAPPTPATSPPRPAGEIVHAAFGERDGTLPRIWLQPADDVERAPSIGPRMAERLYALGIKTVADLFASHPEQLAERLGQRQVDDETIVDWQDQARLVCTVPGLRGTHAQLLVGAGYRTRDALAAASEDKLCAAVLSFAISPDGQRILRDGNPPDIERIKGWLASAITAKVA